MGSTGITAGQSVLGRGFPLPGGFPLPADFPFANGFDDPNESDFVIGLPPANAFLNGLPRNDLGEGEPDSPPCDLVRGFRGGTTSSASAAISFAVSSSSSRFLSAFFFGGGAFRSANLVAKRSREIFSG